MSKLSYEDKIDMYEDRKRGLSLSALVKKYKVNIKSIKYTIRLIDRHGFDVLKTVKNKYYSVQDKERIINRVLLNNESLKCVAIDEGLTSYRMLSN